MKTIANTLQRQAAIERERRKCDIDRTAGVAAAIKYLIKKGRLTWNGK